MITLVVEVCEVKAVYPHPQADSLEFITVKGWQVIVQKALGLAIGQKVVYFVLAVSKRWPEPESAYRAWHKDRAKNDFGEPGRASTCPPVV